MCVEVGWGCHFFFGYWRKSLRVLMGRARGWVFVVLSTLGEGTGRRGDAVAYSVSLSISGVTEPLPICVPNKERPPSLRLLSPNSPASFPLHLPTLLFEHPPPPLCSAVLIFTLVQLAAEGLSGAPVCRCWHILSQLFLPSHLAVLYPLGHACDFCLGQCVCGYVCMIRHKEGT